MPEDPATLRDLAEWYRNFAEVGSAEQRETRLKMAAHLEQRAKALEASRGTTTELGSTLFYRNEAKRLRELADKAANEVARAQLLEVAEQYEQLAGRLERGAN